VTTLRPKRFASSRFDQEDVRAEVQGRARRAAARAAQSDLTVEALQNI
jgi:hypothetical protein